MKSRPNLRNFCYLLGSSLFIQLLGTIYRVWLARQIGGEGLGIFQMVYPIYRLLSSLAAIGLPLALTKWVAEYASKQQFTKITSLSNWAIKTVLYTSLIAALILVLSASLLSSYVFAEQRAKSAFFILAFAIPFSALSSILRGYFQGFSRMAPTALSEISEQLVEISICYYALTRLTTHLPLAAYNYPVVGLTIGEIACLVTLLCFRPWHSSSQTIPNKELPLRRIELINYTWPLLLNQIIVTIGMSAEAALIPRLLQQIYTSGNAATHWFGILNGMASPIAYFPLIFLYPLASVLSPQISAATNQKTNQPLSQKIARYYQAALIICCTGCWFSFTQAAWLSNTLFHSLQPVHLIQILALGLPFSGLATLNLTILSAVGLTEKILILSLWSIGLKTALFFALIRIAGVSGAALAITITQIFICFTSFVQAIPLLNRFSLKIHPKLPLPFRCPKEPH